jgi:hypothetical protein
VAGIADGAPTPHHTGQEALSNKGAEKMRKYLREILLWLFVINLGTVFGAGLYEASVVIPRWQNTPPQTWPNIGLEFWVYVTTVPLTLLTLANLVAAWQEGQEPRRFWWLGAVSITVAERSATFSYFIPTMIRLMETEEMPEEEVKAILSRWLRLDYGRNVLTLVGWLAALKALSLPGESSS